MSEIDEVTGLPVLPEPDMFWRVSAKPADFLLSMTPRRIVVSIWKPKIYLVPTYFSFLGFDLFPLKKRKEEVREVELHGHSVMMENREDRYVHPTRLTKADVLRIAEGVLASYLGTVESELLLGDYPPLTLKENDNVQRV